MSADTDVYGMTAEERAAFEKWKGAPEGTMARSHQAHGWAACVKKYQFIPEALVKDNQCLAAQVESLQIGNNALLARIKELEADIRVLPDELQ